LPSTRIISEKNHFPCFGSDRTNTTKRRGVISRENLFFVRKVNKCEK
jgi:hypothetical protein